MSFDDFELEDITNPEHEVNANTFLNSVREELAERYPGMLKYAFREIPSHIEDIEKIIVDNTQALEIPDSALPAAFKNRIKDGIVGMKRRISELEAQSAGETPVIIGLRFHSEDATQVVAKENAKNFVIDEAVKHNGALNYEDEFSGYPDGENRTCILNIIF